MSDLISKKAAMDALRKEMGADWDSMSAMICDCIEATLNALPPAEPQRIKGRWIGTDYDGFADGNPVYDEWKCSKCGCVVEDEEPTWNFCPNCGADMRGEVDG